MLELKNGRPDSNEGRLEKEIRTYDFLDSLGIEYKRIDHDTADTMEVCAQIDEALQATICKNLFLCNRQETDFYLLMMPGDKPFKTKNITSQTGTGRLSFAPEDKMLEYLDIEPGAVSLMGLMNDHDNNVKLLVDKDLLSEEFVGCHPCVNTSSLKLHTEDAFGKYLKAVHHDMQVVELPWEDAD